jgi:hypothetical protein
LLLDVVYDRSTYFFLQGQVLFERGHIDQ